jgi:hypothetical protein
VSLNDVPLSDFAGERAPVVRLAKGKGQVQKRKEKALGASISIIPACNVDNGAKPSPTINQLKKKKKKERVVSLVPQVVPQYCYGCSINKWSAEFLETSLGTIVSFRTASRNDGVSEGSDVMVAMTLGGTVVTNIINGNANQ